MFSSISARLREPSTGAALAALVALVAPEAAPMIGEGVQHTAALVGISGALWGIFVKEGR